MATKILLFVFLLPVLLFSGKQNYGQHLDSWETLTISENHPYNLLGYTKMLRTNKNVSATEIIADLKAFKSFSNSDISLDPEGNSNYWFIFQISSNTTPVYLSLPITQSYEIELYQIDAESADLISKGGILTPANQKYLNYATELFDLEIQPGSTQTYLLKINRMLYKTFPAQILTSKALFKQYHRNFILEGILLGIIICVVLYHLLIYVRVREKEYLLLSFYMFFLILQIGGTTGLLNAILYFENPRLNHVFFHLIPSFSAFFSLWFSYKFLNISKKTHPKITWIFLSFQSIFILSAISSLFSIPVLERLTILVSGFAAIFLFGVGILRFREKYKPSREYLIAYIPTFFSIPYLLLYTSGNLTYSWFTHNNLLISISLQAILFSLAIAAKIRILKSENEAFLKDENIQLEKMVEHRTAELSNEKSKLESALNNLKATQSQLIQAEKMASLGELTAGIAHEIQNPLNFVNNFSELNKEMLEEMKEELATKNYGDVDKMASEIIINEQKIMHHGKRAESIVKGMLLHSRSNSGQKNQTDINALCNEFLQFSYHGLRAKDKSFNADFKLEADKSLPKINVVPQDIGRVLLNLINNAFYAAPLPPEGGFKDPNYVHKPTVTVKTSFIPPSEKQRGACLISVKDNGPGIPSEIKNKIFQPFFTTKPTGQGTGLGLSISYDIITKGHNGDIMMESNEGEGTEFIIKLPA